MGPHTTESRSSSVCCGQGTWRTPDGKSCENAAHLRELIVLLVWLTLGSLVHGQTVDLPAAAQQDDRVRALALLEADASQANSAQPDGTTALHWAAHHEDAQLVRALLQAGADPNATNRYGMRPLALACEAGDTACVEALLSAGADLEHAMAGGETPLLTAARTGKLGPLLALLRHGADVDHQERRNQTALMWAAAEGHVEAVDALLDAGADPHHRLSSGFTPLFFAARAGHRDVVFRLLQAGIDIHETMRPAKPGGKGPKKGTTALLLAVENGHFSLAESLLEAGARATDSRVGYTPLHALTWVRKPLRGDGDPPPVGSGNLSSIELARALIAHGADVNAKHGTHRPAKERLNRTGATPLLLSAEAGDLTFMRLLVELGADAQIANVEHCTPLLAACGVGVLSDGDETAGTEEEAIAAVTYLLELGNDINAVDDLGKSAMHGAAYKSWTQLIAFLDEQGADESIWNRPSKRGVTPMRIAEGHRPGNFRPSVETMEALARITQFDSSQPSTKPRRDR